MSHAFISYSRANKDYAQKLASAIREKGIEVWIDDRIQIGDAWWHKIEGAIRQSSAVIVIMTPEANTSTWVQREIIPAEDLGIPILPLLVQGNKFSCIAERHYDDVTNGSLPPHSFFERLASFARGKVDIPKSSISDEGRTIHPFDLKVLKELWRFLRYETVHTVLQGYANGAVQSDGLFDLSIYFEMRPNPRYQLYDENLERLLTEFDKALSGAMNEGARLFSPRGGSIEYSYYTVMPHDPPGILSDL